MKQESNWKRIQLVGCSYLGVDSKNWPLIIGYPETEPKGLRFRTVIGIGSENRVQGDNQSEPAALLTAGGGSLLGLDDRSGG